MTPLQQLRYAISVLAASPEKQLRYLVEIGHIDDSHAIDSRTNIDELALQFEDATYLVPGLLRRGHLTPKANRLIDKLNDFTLGLSGVENSEFWTIRALSEDSRWAQVRALAQDCLSEMTENPDQ